MSKVLLCTVKELSLGMSTCFMLEKRSPIGIASLAAVLEKEGIEVDFVDNYVEPIDMRAYIQETKPDWVGIYITSLLYQNFLELLNSIGDLDVRIMVGGPHPSNMPETIPERVDAICIGEGERAIVDIVKGSSPRIVHCPFIEDLNSLPTPKWEIFKGIKYWDYISEFFTSKVFSLCTSRGCPFECRFCSVGSIWGRTYRTLSAENVLKQIEQLKEMFGAEHIYFREDNFTLDRNRVIEFCKKCDVDWVAESRIDNLDKELLEIMASGGCKGLFLGLESGSDRMLDFMKKGITVAQIREKVNMIHDAGIKITANWVINFPTETLEERNMTADLAMELKAAVNNYNIFIGMPRSWGYNYMIENGDYEKIDENFMVYPKGYNDLASQIYGFVPQTRAIK